jgi:ABC-2 type transport system permease protein
MTPYANWVAFYTIVIKEILRFLRIWKQTILPATITTILYFLIFGQLIGSAIGEMDGVAYHEFIIPGLVMMAIISNAYGNTVSSFFSSKFHGHIEELIVSPVPNYIILLGFIGGGIARGLTVGLAVTLVVFFFTDLSIESPLITFSIVVLTATLFSLIGILNGIFAKNFDDISIVPNFVLTPLSYLGGVFYSISLLPEFWQQVSLLNPVLYMINAFRYGILGISDISLLTSYLIIIFSIVVFFIYTLYLLKKGKGIRS